MRHKYLRTYNRFYKVGVNMINNTMFWSAIDNLAAARHISCSHMARISGIDATALNKSKRIGTDGRRYWMSVGTLVKILDATHTEWAEFAKYFPQNSK